MTFLTLHLPPPPPPPSCQGKTVDAGLDDFKQVAKEGRGVHGTVFRAVHKPSNMTMAMKEIELERVTEETSQRIVRCEKFGEIREEAVVLCWVHFLLELTVCCHRHSELDVLKEGSECPYIVDYFGAFFKHVCLGPALHPVSLAVPSPATPAPLLSVQHLYSHGVHGRRGAGQNPRPSQFVPRLARHSPPPWSINPPSPPLQMYRASRRSLLARLR